MVEKIMNILSKSDINGWKIVENKTESSELFFIKKELDMNRAKNVHNFKVTVYKDFVENGVKYRGSSTTNIHPTMNEKEIKKAIDEAAFAASFVKNEYYPLVKPTDINPPSVKSNFSQSDISEWLPKLTDAIFKSDNFDKGWLNSVELFLNKIYTRIVNSEGVDVNFETYKGELEFITNWQEEGEEIELYKYISFSDFDEIYVSEQVKEMLALSREKATANPTPALNKHTVLLTGDPVKEFFTYYYVQSNTQYVYEGISTSKLNENIQGNNAKGDLINMKLNPFVEGSVYSSPYDYDGLPLKPVNILENGVLSKYWGDSRYSYYLNIEPTGTISNIIVDGGSKSSNEFKQQPYLEVAVFSDFQMDPLTGNFAGEIRLGWYFDGSTTIPVTGGSISGNIKEVQNEMYLSNEIQRNDNFIGPKTIQLFNVTVSG